MDSEKPAPAKAFHFNMSDSMGVVALVLAVVPMAIRPPLWSKPILLLAIACLSLVFAHRSHWTHSWQSGGRWTLGALLTIVFCGIGIVQFVGDWKIEHPNLSQAESLQTQPPGVDDQLRPAYVRPLGNPIGPAEPGHITYQGVFRNAIVIWNDTLSTFFVLRKQSDELRVYPDPSWDADGPWFSDEDLAREFPGMKDPPYGGLARMWKDNPAAWRWIGPREWHAMYTTLDPRPTVSNSATRFQKFENGLIIGLLRMNLEQDRALVVALITDGAQTGHYSQVTLPQTPPVAQMPWKYSNKTANQRRF